MSYGVVLVTAKDMNEAEVLSRGLLEKKLVACCNIVRDVRSLYWWRGKADESQEVLLVIKTRQELFSPLVSVVKALHSYSVPEIIMLPIIDGQQDYLSWIDDVTERTSG